MKKTSLYLLTIRITKIALKVRFPCSVCCSFKIDTKERDICGEAQLKNGEAQLTLMHSQQLQLTDGREESSLLQKKCALLVYLISSSGRIPAGSVLLSTVQITPQFRRQITRIDKCPDKNAIIEFEVKVQKSGSRNQISSCSIESQFKSSKSDLQNLEMVGSQKYTSKRTSSNLMRGSQVTESSKQTTYIRKIMPKRESRIIEDCYSGDTKRLDPQKVYSFERKIENYRMKLAILQNQINNKSNLANEAERDYKNQLKKTQQLQLDLKTSNSKIQCSQKVVKQLNGRLSQLKQQFDEQKLGLQNGIKRLEIRQNSYKEQIRTITNKLYVSQNEKQRMIFEKNLSSNQFQSREKKLRETFKEKQKRMVEEKTTLLKKIDSLSKDMEEFNDHMAELKAKNTQSIQQGHQLRLIIENLEAENDKFRNQCNDLRFGLTRLKNQKTIIEDNLEVVTKFNEEKRNFRRQLSQINLENSQLKEKITNLEGVYTKGKSNSQQIEKSLKQKTNQLKILDRDYNILLKEHRLINGDLSSKQVKINSLIEELQLERKRQKLQELKLAQIQEKYFDSQEDSLKKIRQMENQIEKLNQQLFTCTQQIVTSKKDNEDLQQMLQQKAETLHNLQSQLIHLNQINQHCQLEKIEISEERKEVESQYQSKLEQSNQCIKQLRETLAENNNKYELKVSDLAEEVKQSKQKIKSLVNSLRQEQQRNYQLKKGIKTAEIQAEKMLNLRQNQAKQKQYLQLKNNQLNLSIVQLNRLCEDKDLTIKSLRSNIAQMEHQQDQVQKRHYLQIQYYKKTIQQRQSLIAELQSDNYLLQQQHNLKAENLSIISKDLQYIKINTGGFTEEVNHKNVYINELKDQITAKQKEMTRISIESNQKISTLSASLIQKSKEIAELKNLKIQLQRQQMSRLVEYDISMRSVMERVNMLQAENNNFEAQLKNQLESGRKLMRELQSKCYQCQQLQIKHQEEEQNATEYLRLLDQQKDQIESIHQNYEDLMRILNNLEKDKKINAYVLIPIREVAEKIEDSILAIVERSTVMISQRKRTDVARLRVKRTTSKKEEPSSAISIRF